MKNKREIIESKYPPINNEDLWLKNLLLYTSTSKGWEPLGIEKTYSSKEELLADKPAGGTIGVDSETGKAYLYNDVSKEWTPVGGGGGGMTETTWQELKDKRDAGKLTPGALYRITDYNCTTTQENTKSAGHQFDIVLLALSEDKLAEEGWAMMNESNIYDVSFDDGVTKKCYYAVTDSSINLIDCATLLGLDGIGVNDFSINESTKTIIADGLNSTDLDVPDLTYNYFQNSNLSAWKVWYCLDNDTSRFAWADDSLDMTLPNSITLNDGNGYVYVRQSAYDMTRSNVNYYAWQGNDSSKSLGIAYTTEENPQSDDTTWYYDTRFYDWRTGASVLKYYPVDTPPGSLMELLTIKDTEEDHTIQIKRLQSYWPDAPRSQDIDGVTYYLWGNEGQFLTLKEYPEVDDKVYWYSLDLNEVMEMGYVLAYQPERLIYNGKGVIYRLIDEWNNDCPYDFKNIQFVRKLTNGVYDASGTNTWVYTFNFYYAKYDDMVDGSVKYGNYSLCDDGSFYGIMNNYIESNNTYRSPLHIASGQTHTMFALGDNVFLLRTWNNTDTFAGCCNNKIIGQCNRLTISTGINHCHFLDRCENLILTTNNYLDAMTSVILICVMSITISQANNVTGIIYGSDRNMVQPDGIYFYGKKVLTET